LILLAFQQAADSMIDRLIFTALVLAFILGPLVWRVWHDRLADHGLVLRADIAAALRRALGGESFVAIEVVVATAWRRGQVVLSVPAGWDHLVKAAWDQVVAALPANYDLVVCGAHRRGGAKASATFPPIIQS
jgi:hypothetical protein